MKRTFEQPVIQVQSLMPDEIMLGLSGFFSTFSVTNGQGGDDIID